jgi:hypothetical protein
MKLQTLIVALLYASVPRSIGASTIAAPTVTTPTAAATKQADTGEGGNAIVQLFGYIKDSLVRTVDGSRELWRNHGRCNEIRAKQKDYREQLKKQWEFEEQGLTPQEVKKRLKNVNGGITYDEFMFLAKGKEDRAKLMNLLFLTWGAPRFLPYMLMFNQNMLPSPFSTLSEVSSTRETKLEKLSRQRTHAVIKTLLTIEDQARNVPALAKLNIFGRKKQERAMDDIERFGKACSDLMQRPEASSGDGAAMLLKSLEPKLFQDEFDRASKRLVHIPKPILKGLVECMEGPSVINNILPNFMSRGKLVERITKITEADNFLVDEKVDLGSLSTARLLEACNDRLMGGPGRTDEELRSYLSGWLNLAVRQPNERVAETGKEYNGAVARAAMMSFYAAEGARDSRSASYLPKALLQDKNVATTESSSSGKKKR